MIHRPGTQHGNADAYPEEHVLSVVYEIEKMLVTYVGHTSLSSLQTEWLTLLTFYFHIECKSTVPDTDKTKKYTTHEIMKEMIQFLFWQ